MADYVVIDGAEAWEAEGEGERAAVGVVVVHGFTGNPISMRPLADRLHREGFTVAMPRLPGHGTHHRDLAGTRYRDWLATVEHEVDRVAERCDRVVLVGLSMGGTLVLDVGARRQVAGVVVVNPFVLDPPGLLPRLVPVLQHLVPMVPAAVAGIAADDIKKPGITEQAYPNVPMKAAYSLTRALPRVRAQLAELTAPVLVCRSREDHTVDPANAEALLRLLPGDDVRDLVLEESYHVATLDNDQELLEQTVTDFVAEVTGT